VKPVGACKCLRAPTLHHLSTTLVSLPTRNIRRNIELENPESSSSISVRPRARLIEMGVRSTTTPQKQKAARTTVKERRSRTLNQWLQAKAIPKTTAKRMKTSPRQALRQKPGGPGPGTRLGASKHLAITIDDSNDESDGDEEAPMGIYEPRRYEDESDNATIVSLTSTEGRSYLQVASQPKYHPATASCPPPRHHRYIPRSTVHPR
jgi:hypothetical protein